MKMSHLHLSQHLSLFQENFLLCNLFHHLSKLFLVLHTAGNLKGKKNISLKKNYKKDQVVPFPKMLLIKKHLGSMNLKKVIAKLGNSIRKIEPYCVKGIH